VTSSRREGAMIEEPNSLEPTVDPELLARAAGLWPRLASALVQTGVRQFREVTGQDYTLIDYPGLMQAAGQFWVSAISNPLHLWQAQADLMQRGIALMNRSGAVPNGEAAEAPAKGSFDKRFTHKAWSEDPGLRVMRDGYLAYSGWLLDEIRQSTALDSHDRRKLEFYARQMLSAVCPANFVATNPSVRSRAKETNGESLIRGLENLVNDLESGNGMLPISQYDANAYEVGRNLALTPGKVVYRNDLIELIQYEASTDTVHKRPLLFVPPWINKYYVLDLQPQNSFFRWLVAQGHTVFVISWVNPGPDHAQKGFEDYMREGPLTAIDVVQRITGEPEINIGGFCIGGILTVCMLAYLAAKGESPIRSATLLATMIDLSDVGDASIFIDDAQLANIERHTREHGYLDGYHMRDMFSLLRENDLVWNYVVSNYLMGRTPPAFDILHWNADSTRLPARMLTDFLSEMYMRNSLVKQGTMHLLGEPIDVRRIKVPSYFISTMDDHIAPWRATYPATQLFKGPVEFVLGGSGHIAGIVNPPTKNKYSYRTGDRYPRQAQDWFDKAGQHQGSWWPHWAKWLEPHGGPMVKARAVGSRAFKPLCDAPGTYVRAS
jgi:polyhydroxyalkanoate synthase